jgi:penicillin-insensitive murein endopeptidase
VHRIGLDLGGARGKIPSRATHFALALLLLTASAGCADFAGNPWAKVRTVSYGTPQAIGLASAGCVRGAMALPLDGVGYHVMRSSRKRFYGHPNLIGFIQTLGRQLEDRGIGTMLVGDIGQPRGGPTISMHRSHQSGLDVDIWFWLPPDLGSRPLTDAEREGWDAPSVLGADRRSLHPMLWTPDHVEMLRMAAAHPEVDRIFVHPAIKQELCARETDRVWLKKLRPWWGHDDHLHVRLRCPTGESLCVSQEPIPPGDGCDGSLAWWFSDEARLKAPRGTSEPPPMPRLPAACTALLKGS